MVLQNETADAGDDLEHFEDILEEEDNKGVTKPDKDDDKDSIAQSSNGSPSDSDDNDSSLDENGSEDDGYNDEEDDLLGEGGLDKRNKFKLTINHEVQNLLSTNINHEVQNLLSTNGSVALPGGYNPRHREPTFCNADRVGWWELTVLASHVHPSVSAMASTLLSGVNIVYNGNPLIDLSLGAFLDKFMEKKAKQSTWHGASQIEPAKKLDMNHHLIGAEILSLAESDVPPEDVVFHKFYMNKMNSTKKPKKKKKKTAEEEDAEEIFGVDGDEDESDNEEIENILDSTFAPASEADNGEYDYDDLDKIVNDEEEDLIGDVSDEEMNFSPNQEIEEDEIGDAGGDDVAIGDVNDGSDFEDMIDRSKKKRKSRGKVGASPFASLEDYQHMMGDEAEDPDMENSSEKKKKRKIKKTKKKKKTVE